MSYSKLACGSRERKLKQREANRNPVKAAPAPEPDLKADAPSALLQWWMEARGES